MNAFEILKNILGENPKTYLILGLILAILGIGGIYSAVKEETKAKSSPSEQIIRLSSVRLIVAILFVALGIFLFAIGINY